MRVFILAIILFSVAAVPVHSAPVVELNLDQLRSAITSKSVINPRRVYAAVESKMKSEPVDIRVFKSDRVYYRVLVKSSNGKMKSIIVDAKSGTLISALSSVARKINATASGGSVVVQASSTSSEGSQSASSGSRSSGGSGGSGQGGDGQGGGGDDDDDDDDDDQGDDDDD